MAGLFKEAELNKYGLNRGEVLHHSVKGFIGISAEQYAKLEPAEAQELRVQRAVESCKGLPYFLQQVLSKMLRWEALERPNFIKLRKIFQDENDRLALNIDNKTFVDDLLNNVMT